MTHESVKRLRDITREKQAKNVEREYLHKLSFFLKSSVGLNGEDQYFIPDSMKDNELVVELGGSERATELLIEYKKRDDERIKNHEDSEYDIARAEAWKEYFSKQWAMIKAITEAMDRDNEILTDEEKEQRQKQRDEYEKTIEPTVWDDELREEFGQYIREAAYEQWFKLYAGMTCKHFVSW